MSELYIAELFQRHQPPFNQQQYQALLNQANHQPDTFWNEQAVKNITWHKSWQKTMDGSFSEGTLSWFCSAELNACYNCLDRHLPQQANKTALIWVADETGVSRHITYQELFKDVCRFANVLLKLGVKKGDIVCIYLPMIPESIIAMLACARIGAIHSVIFAGFSAHALRDRIIDANAKLVITADFARRGGKIIPLKANVDEAIAEIDIVEHVLVVKNVGQKIAWDKDRDICLTEILQDVSATHQAVMMEANEPLFVLYTSGSTGKPKGIVHAVGGYLVYVATTFNTVFDYQAKDIYWCTADIGWITGHSYVVYGPLSQGATVVVHEGIPTYPDAGRCWQIIDKFKVSIFYTAPTAIRSLLSYGDDYVKKYQRTSLRLLGTVGEPINPEVWKWYYDVIGGNHCAIVDTWWQTETGGFMIAPIPGITNLKPGSATKPFIGISAEIVDEEGHQLPKGKQGNLLISTPWPGMARTILHDHQRFKDIYLKKYPGKYFAGDAAIEDEESYFWIIGRVDDVIKVSGHRLGTAEVESGIVAHPAVTEAAVVGVPHPIKGEAIYAFVTLKNNIQPSEQLKKEIIEKVSHEVGAIAKPDYIQWASALPKTRSGKIMRRILRKIAEGEVQYLGDTSTLTDPNIIKELLENVEK